MISYKKYKKYQTNIVKIIVKTYHHKFILKNQNLNII